jgi:type II restriction/modification system DNA methylase subunit YeeA
MLEAQKKYHSARMESDKTMYKREIKRLDTEIDNLVYKLYELTDEEIKIIEESVK